MASNARVFLAGVGTTFVILAIGFGGGVMLAKTAMEPSVSSRLIADRLSPVRIILPASAEAAMPPQPPVELAAAPEPSSPVLAANEARRAFEREKQIERAERRKTEAEELARRKKYAERKARREAARLVNQKQGQQPGILALGGDGDQSRGGAGSFFGN